ncbi:hypothetical protein G7Y89_g11103 [Cudoniella acicularis]|uniref:Uncharacterized protein n=1 Tax=Cudoniella acicularis TaxID=354080 RepID=A0A8H4RCJ5_9HELO|nr:hypothetical protein G7Y89_g11103 [Cudoniella acicularis]
MPPERKSKKSDKPTAWSEWEWNKSRDQWGRYRISRGEYEYEWRDPEPTAKLEEKNKGKEKEKEEKGNLSVAVYRPRWGNLGNCLYEVTGEAMHFTAESIPVAEIHPTDIAELHRVITETPVQNDVQQWCCQDYVLEALEGLNNEQIVDDEDFGKAKKRLMEIFNN